METAIILQDFKVYTINRNSLKSSKTHSSITHQDHISQLPDDVLIHILSFLPMDSAVLTSFLSRKWRHLWKENSVIEFHSIHSSGVREGYDHITNCLLYSIASKITKFSVVDFVDPRVENMDHIRQNVMVWISLALQKGVKFLKIGLGVFPIFRFFELPGVLFEKNKTHSLERIYMSSVDFSPPRSTAFEGFVSLKVLSLSLCIVSDETIRVVLSKCLALEVLIIDNCEVPANVSIRGPNLSLRELVFRKNTIVLPLGTAAILEVVNVPSLEILRYFGELTSIHLKGLPGLLSVKLFSEKNIFDEANIDQLRTLVNELAHLRAFVANSWLTQFAAKVHTLEGSQIALFPELCTFTWTGLVASENDIKKLFAFVQGCPSLKMIEVDLRVNFWDGFCDYIIESYEDPGFQKTESGQEEEPPSLEKVEYVRMLSFIGYDGEMELAKALLQKASSLKRMDVYWRSPFWVLTKNELVKGIFTSSKNYGEFQSKRPRIGRQLSNFPRASSEAQVIFHESTL